MTVLIDSWAWIEYWKGGSYADKAQKHIEAKEETIISTLNMLEIYHWILQHYDVGVAEAKKNTLRKRCFIIPVDEEIAIEAARIKHSLKLALADSVILATARKIGAKIVTGDPDFKGMREVIYIGD
ncbi:MAG: type II toxin-antitoxin system VapC family toxin [Nitrososphaerales archaeon]